MTGNIDMALNAITWTAVGPATGNMSITNGVIDGGTGAGSNILIKTATPGGIVVESPSSSIGLSNGATTSSLVAGAGNNTYTFQAGSGTIAFVGEYDTAEVYTPTNVTTDRSFDANSTSLDELADIVGTLIADLQGVNILS
jgi:hypothetical protein